MSVFATLAIIGLAGVAGFATRADAQQPPLSVACPPLVSVAWCSNSRNQSDRCWSFNTNACATTLTNNFTGEHQRLTNRQTPAGDSPHYAFPLLLPQGMSGSERATNGARISYDQSRLGQVDTDLSYSTVIGLSQRATNPRFGRFDLRGVNALTEPLHPEWESSGARGNEVHSCKEYVYKKYYDYSRFEDAAASCKSDWSCIYNLAITRTTPGINFWPLKKKQGTGMTSQLTPLFLFGQPTFSQPKNAFWRPDSWSSVGYSTPLILQFGAWIENAGRHDVATGINNAMGLTPDAMSQPYQISDRWSWHIQMHDRQVPENLTYAAYEDMESRQKRISELYDQFEAARRGATPGQFIDVMTNPSGVWTPVRRCLDPHFLDPDYRTEYTRCTHWGPPQLPDGYYYQGPLRSIVLAIVDLLIAEWDHKSIDTGVPDRGCLDRNSNRCDWSPKMFAKEYTGRFRSEREQDYQNCLVWTLDDFTAGPDHHTLAMTDDTFRDSDALESWIARAQGDPYLEKLRSSIPWAGQTVGDSTSGGKSLGDPNFFFASYEYSAGWDADFTVDDVPAPHLCGVQGHLNGHLYAGAVVARGLNILRSDYTLIDFTMDARAGQHGDPNAYASGHLIVWNNELYRSRTPSGAEGEVDAANFNLSPAYHNGIPVLDAVIPVAAVPIHLQASLDLSAGLTARVRGSAPQPQHCSTDGHDVSMTLSANVTPYANAGASLSAAVGVSLAGFGAEAGVRGDLSLLKVSVPLNVSMLVDNAPLRDVNGFHVPADPQYQGNRRSLILDTNASIDVSALSGSVSAFAKIAFVTIEKELFRWDGVNLAHVDLFRLSQPYPLEVVQQARVARRSR